MLVVGLEGGQYTYFRMTHGDGSVDFDKIAAFQSSNPALPIGCLALTERGQRIECIARDWPPLPLGADGTAGTTPTPHAPHFVVFGFDNHVRIHTALAHNNRISKAAHDEIFFVRMYLLDQLGRKRPTRIRPGREAAVAMVALTRLRRVRVWVGPGHGASQPAAASPA